MKTWGECTSQVIFFLNKTLRFFFRVSWAVSTNVSTGPSLLPERSSMTVTSPHGTTVATMNGCNRRPTKGTATFWATKTKNVLQPPHGRAVWLEMIAAISVVAGRDITISQTKRRECHTKTKKFVPLVFICISLRWPAVAWRLREKATVLKGRRQICGRRAVAFMKTIKSHRLYCGRLLHKAHPPSAGLSVLRCIKILQQPEPSTTDETAFLCWYILHWNIL